MSINYHQKFEETGIYHIYNRTIQELDLFRNNDDYHHFLNKFREYFTRYMDVVGYCLIPNHFHFIVQIKHTESILKNAISEKTQAAINFAKGQIPVNDFLEDQMRRFFSAISLRYNHRYKRRGALFSDRMKRIRIVDENKLVYLLCYVHHNPVHHHIVNDYGEWEYSSYRSYLNHDRYSLLSKGIITLFENSDRFRSIHEEFKQQFEKCL